VPILLRGGHFLKETLHFILFNPPSHHSGKDLIWVQKFIEQLLYSLNFVSSVQTRWELQNKNQEIDLEYKVIQ
jgi:pyruvate dehydrogenase complex dehydrogenase (E1) component